MLNGSILVFLGVYVSRIGGTPFQVGLLSAIPALVNIAVTFPGNAFARGHSTYNITRWAWLIMRLFYILIIPLPLLVEAQVQIWIILGVILVMSIPGTVASVIGNAFFAETVPIEYCRPGGRDARNAIMAATTMLTTFTVGQVVASSRWQPATPWIWHWPPGRCDECCPALPYSPSHSVVCPHMLRFQITLAAHSCCQPTACASRSGKGLLARSC